MEKVYFDVGWSRNSEFLESVVRMTPDNNGIWNDIEATESPEDSDYHIAFNAPSIPDAYSQTLLFCMEPPCTRHCLKWDRFDGIKYPVDEFYKPQRWWIDLDYDRLKELKPPKKSRNLSWITTDKGRLNGLYGKFRRWLLSNDWKIHEYKDLPIVPRRINYLNKDLDGHIMRMGFLNKLKENRFAELDLYGRGAFDDIDFYKGEIENKYDGLKNYRYSLAFENCKGKNYFSEKIVDALLSWAMPIYWGCENLSEFLPQRSYVRFDIERDNPEKIQEIIHSDLRENNLDAIAEAREIILDELQIWPTIEKCIQELE